MDGETYDYAPLTVTAREGVTFKHGLLRERRGQPTYVGRFDRGGRPEERGKFGLFVAVPFVSDAGRDWIDGILLCGLLQRINKFVAVTPALGIPGDWIANHYGRAYQISVQHEHVQDAAAEVLAWFDALKTIDKACKEPTMAHELADLDVREVSLTNKVV